jgi:hypothetical protein
MPELPNIADSQNLDTPAGPDDYDLAEVETAEVKADTEADRTPEELSEAEEQIIQSVQELGLEYRRSTSSLMLFARRRAESEDTRPPILTGIPRSSVPDLAQQLGNGIVNHPTSLGFMIPVLGYSEMVLRGYGGVPAIYTVETVLRLSSDATDCKHNQEREIFTVPVRQRQREGSDPEIASPRLHISNPDGLACVEISNASPLGLLLYGPRPFGDEARSLPTIKIDFGKAVDGRSIIKNTDDLVRALIYELDVRNNVIVGTRTRPLPREAREPARHRRAGMHKARYPKMRIQHEVSDLFNFAAQAADNSPLAFLSYYQTLEYFIPAAVRQNALKRIRRELHDPTFDEDSDNCLLRIVTATERSVNVPEASQLRTLIKEFVRKDRLEEFFHQEWGNYFTRKGPIQGVEVINLSNTTDVSEQVADRIYQIRNRIVHARDDPRYRDARVLLPQSQEAQALGPDVELVRLLAIEAILSGQGL